MLENKRKQRVSPPRPHEEDNNHILINSKLDAFQNKAKSYFLECSLRDIEISKKLIKDYFKGIKIDLKPIKKDFWESYEEYIKIGERGKSNQY